MATNGLPELYLDEANAITIKNLGVDAASLAEPQRSLVILARHQVDAVEAVVLARFAQHQERN